jgi:hypothetical protein
MRRNGMAALALVGVLAFVACEDDDEDSNRFEATLSGAAERPTQVTTNATGTFSLTDNGGSMTFTLNVNGLPQVASAAHIHVAPTRPGTNLPAAADTFGGIVAPLTISNTVQTGILGQGAVTLNVSIDSLRALLNNGRAYANVHTAANPAGHIRGNITRD